MKHASYLSHLRFDKNLLNTIQARYLRNPRLLILILILIIGIGTFSYVNLPRRLNPQINIPIVIVSTVFPGASPDDVEALITKPIEDSIDGIPNVKAFTSASRDSVSLVQIEFNTGIDPDKATSDVKSEVDSVSLPSDAVDPQVFKIDFEQFPIWSFSLTSKKGDIASLMSFSEDLKKRLEDLPSVDKVTTSGLEEAEIQILIKKEALSSFSFNPQVLMSQLSFATKSFPAGSVRTDSSNFTLAIDPLIVSLDDIRNIKINTGDRIVNLSDIAVISKKSKPSQPQSFVAKAKEEPRKSITFSIFNNKNFNINKTYEEARTEVDSQISRYQNEFLLFSTSNISEEIDRQFNELIRDFALTIVLVFLALFIFLGIRQAVVSSISIPLTFLITFTIMSIAGISLSFISYFSLLLALGLLVDDTIVVISAATSYYRSGKFTPFETALLAWRDFIVPIFTTTLTTVFAFVPLLLASGIIGEFIKPIPIVVSSILLASFFVAMFITLPIVVYILKPALPRRARLFLTGLGLMITIILIATFSKGSILLLPTIFIFAITLLLLFWFRNIYVTESRKKISKNFSQYKKYVDHGVLSFEDISIRYQILIKKILSSRKWLRATIVIVVIFTVFSYLLLPVGLVKNEFFPKVDSDQVFVSVELPPGTNIEKSKKEALVIFNKLSNGENIETISLDLGQASGEFGAPVSSEANNFFFTLVLKEERDKKSFEVAEQIRKDFKDYALGKFSVIEESGGPPAGSDIQIKLLGQDLSVLDKYANEIVGYLEDHPGITSADKSIKPGTSKITFIPDKTKLAEYQISSEQIGFHLRTFAQGFKVGSITLDEGSSEDDINLRFSENSEFAERVSAILVPSPQGLQVPLTELGTLQLRSSPTIITREDGDRTLSATAGVRRGYVITEVNKDLENFAKKLDLPPGYTWKTGGVNEENQESVNSILYAMILSFVLILGTMVIQFASFRKAVIVILVIPLSISGVFIIFGLTNTPLSFPALIGVLALFGIVVKNSILIVDKITANEKTKMEFKEGIAEGAASRLEPIALTSFAAILGLLPITVSDPLWRGLGGAIVAGLVFSGTIMLFFIPVVYYLIFRGSKKSRD